MYSALVSYHTNPYTCGVARFNRALAEVLGTRLVSLNEFLSVSSRDRFLISLKLEEIDVDTLSRLEDVVGSDLLSFDLFLHGVNESTLEKLLCIRATRVFANSAELAARISSLRQDVVSVFSPGAPVLPKLQDVELRFLTIGMAHKLKTDRYAVLSEFLSRDGRTYRLDVSTALHEGGTFAEILFKLSEDVSVLFSGNVHFLGFLSDAEVSQQLRDVDAFVAFFPSGVRENNTTVLSAMSHGCPIITNLDGFSPQWMKHGVTVLNLAELCGIPSKAELVRIGNAGKLAVGQYSFEALARLILSR